MNDEYEFDVGDKIIMKQDERIYGKVVRKEIKDDGVHYKINISDNSILIPMLSELVKLLFKLDINAMKMKKLKKLLE